MIVQSTDGTRVSGRCHPAGTRRWMPIYARLTNLMAVSLSSGRTRFGVFEVDPSSGELRKQGIKIKLHHQPFCILCLLLENAGRVVTREELAHLLWPSGVYVDSEVGLNSAVTKLRSALGDSAESPRFIETLPRRGYRFIAAVESIPTTTPQANPASNELQPTQLPLAGSDSHMIPPLALEVAIPARTTWRRQPNVLLACSAALLLTALVALSLYMSRGAGHKPSIAVLPLQNLSPELGSDGFADGLTDEITRNFSTIQNLEVKSSASSFLFKDKPRNASAVGRQLGVDYIFDGSVFRAQQHLRVNVRLIRVADGFAVWSGRYDRELDDIFVIQDDISRSITNELRLKLGAGQRRYNTSVEAYENYLRALPLLNRHPGPESGEIAASIPYFQAAIAKDPDFAPAYAGIANAYAYLSATPRTFSPKEAYPKMVEACRKSLALDPLLPEGHACMGLIHARDFSWTQAEDSFRTAIKLDPNLSRARLDLAIWVLVPLNRMEEAIAESRKALALDPLSDKALNNLDYVLLAAGQNDEVIANSRRLLAAAPDNYTAQQLYGRALVASGKVEDGAKVFEDLVVGSEAFLGYAYAKAGRTSESLQIIAQHPEWPWLRAVVYSGLGQQDQAYQGLKQMVDIQDPRAALYFRSPELAALRSGPYDSDVRKLLSLNEP